MVIEATVGGVHQLIFNHVVAGRAAQLPELTYFVLVPFVGRRAAVATAGLT